MPSFPQQWRNAKIPDRYAYRGFFVGEAALHRFQKIVLLLFTY